MSFTFHYCKITDLKGKHYKKKNIGENIEIKRNESFYHFNLKILRIKLLHIEYFGSLLVQNSPERVTPSLSTNKPRSSAVRNKNFLETNISQGILHAALWPASSKVKSLLSTHQNIFKDVLRCISDVHWNIQKNKSFFHDPALKV